MKKTLTTDHTDSTDNNLPQKGAKGAEKLELVTEEEAGFRKRVKTWFGLLQNAGAQMIGYRVIIGAELNAAAEALPHGQFEKWVREEVGMPDSTQKDWRSFSKLFLEEATKLPALPTVGKRPAVGLLNVSNLKSKNARKMILEIVPKIMGGRGMVDFCREIKLLKEPAKDGGYRPDPEMVREFLAAVHPDLAKRTDGTDRTYEELEPKLQREFRKWLAGRPEPPEDVIKRANDLAESTKVCLVQAITGKWLMAVSPEKRADLLICAEKLAEKLKGLEKPKLELGKQKAETLTADGADDTDEKPPEFQPPTGVRMRPHERAIQHWKAKRARRVTAPQSVAQPCVPISSGQRPAATTRL